MTDWIFKNGITIHIPDVSKEDQIERWTEVKMQMSILLDPPPLVQTKQRKPYTFTKRGIAKRLKFNTRWKKKT